MKMMSMKYTVGRLGTVVSVFALAHMLCAFTLLVTLHDAETGGSRKLLASDPTIPPIQIPARDHRACGQTSVKSALTRLAQEPRLIPPVPIARQVCQLASARDPVNPLQEKIRRLEHQKPASPPSRKPMKKALIITLSYASKNEKEQYLPNRHASGEMIEEMVTSLGYTVKVITDASQSQDDDQKVDDKKECESSSEECKPFSYETFEKDLNDWFADVVSGDQLFVYYAGHGCLLRYQKGEVKPADCNSPHTVNDPHNALSPGHFEAQTPVYYGRFSAGPDARNLPVLYLGQGKYYKGLHKALRELDGRVSGVKVVGVMNCCHSEKLMELKYTMNNQQSRCSKYPWEDSRGKRTRRSDRNLFISIAECRKDQLGIDHSALSFVRNLCQLSHRTDSEFFTQMCNVEMKQFGNSQKGDRIYDPAFGKDPVPRNLTVTCSNDNLDVDSFNWHQLLTENFFEDGFLRSEYTLKKSDMRSLE